MSKDVIPPQVAALLEGGNKIGAIKELRGITGLGLKEAKDWIDNYERGMADPLPEPVVAAEGNVKATFTLTREAVDALKSGNKIEAIKIVREATGLGLAEAKQLVDMASPSRERPVAGQGLAPGQVAPSGGAGKWVFLIVVAGAILAAIFLAGCSAMPASEADTRRLLAAQADAWDKALIAKDRAGIEANMAPEFVQMRGSGQLVAREQFIRDVMDPGFRMDPYKVEDWEARLFGDTALVYGRIRMSGVADGQRWSAHFRYIDTYVRRDGRWQVVSVQITPMP